MRSFSFTSSLAILAMGAEAGLLQDLHVRQATTSSATSTPAAVTTGPLIETTIDGKVTTVPVAVPTTSVGTSTTAQSPSKTSNAAATGTVSEGSPGVPDDAALSCHNSKEQPICQPHENQKLLVGNTYWIQWSSTAFPANTSITVGLQYTNDTSQVAWLSSSYVTQRGFTTVTIEESWLQGWNANNLSLVWNAFSSDASDRKIAFNVELQEKPKEHYPPPPTSKMPDKHSLLIALPVTVGVLFIVLFGLCIGMKQHRKIGMGSVMGRGRRGYGTGKSRRQRMGIKKGAIRLEDREIAASEDEYRDVEDDEIRRASQQQQTIWPIPPKKESGTTNHRQDLSLGSLVTDDDSNSFRREVMQQQREKQ